MQLEGIRITHVTFGTGTVTNLSQNMITVCFPQGEKKFLFPDSFTRFLSLEDPKAQKRVDEVLRKREQAAEEERRAAEREQERRQRIRSLKPGPESQAALGLVENTAEEIFSSWTASAGSYLSGASKGKPRVPTRLKLNSACLVTACPPGEAEAERRILGVFMVPDDFDGAQCLDGRIESHEAYRLHLAADKSPRFWPYFAGAVPAQWGRTEIKYFSNRTMQTILLELMTASDEEERPAAESFYRYFCQVNQLEPLPEESLEAAEEES